MSTGKKCLRQEEGHSREDNAANPNVDERVGLGLSAPHRAIKRGKNRDMTLPASDWGFRSMN